VVSSVPREPTVGGHLPGQRRRAANQIVGRVFGVHSRAAGPPPAGRDIPAARFVIHLRATSPDLPAAVDLAYALVRSLGFLPEIDAGRSTVSNGDAPGVHHRVCCDRLLPRRRRCAMRVGHHGPCAADPPDEPTATR
jgi:hypothetical protein